jgi:hypothetical protein
MSVANACFSTMFQATTASTPARHASGMKLASGSRRDGDRHGERKGNDRDRQPGHGVGAKIREAVTFPKNRDELRREELAECRSRDFARRCG